MVRLSGKRWMISLLILVVLLVGANPVIAAGPTPAPAPADVTYNLTILHTNDIHAHHAASPDGGAALAAGVINQVRKSTPNTLLLNAGDNFTGTLFYVMHHGIDSAKIMNAMKYDAMTLGNHEFDEGDGNLALFLAQIKFPVTAANVDFEKSSTLKGKVKPYVVLTRGGQQIGVIGLANPNTPSESRPGSDLVFMSNTAEVVQKAVDELTAAGVNKIIVLSHIGYTADQDLAKNVHGVDVIVGGHSHTLLANFDTRAQGPYPTVVKDTAGKNVLVVQAGEYEQYLGRLDVVFDGNGDLKSWSGDAIYLSHYLPPDPQIAALVAGLNKPIEALTKQKIGSSSVDLNGDRKVCRFAECSMGNLITDAMRSDTGAQIALENGGGIRASMTAGDITLGDVLNVLPFGNLVSTFKLKGADLKAVLENSVSRVDAEEGTGRFLQVSGLRFTFDAKQPVGSRIVSVEVLDASGKYQALKEDEVYTVATNDFTREGGDDNTVLKEKAIDAYDYGRPLDQVLTDYIRAHSPVNTTVEGRITAK